MPRMNVDRPIEVKAEERVIDDLKFDLKNIRFFHLPEEKRPRTTEEIRNWLWENMGESIRRLYNSIVNSRGLHEELFIRPDGTVVEGNERLACLLRAREQAAEGKLNGTPPEAFEKVDVKVFPAGTPERSIKIWLARLHVVGKDQWKLVNQAGLVTELVDELGSQDDVATLIGLSKTTVNQLVRAYATFREFRANYSDADPEKFSYFVELHKAKDLSTWFNEDPANRAKFHTWVATDKLNATGAKDCRRLMAVLEDTDARKEFLAPGGDMRQALYVLDSKDPTFRSPTLKVVQKAIEALLSMGTDEKLEIAEDRGKSDLMSRLQTVTEVILEEIENLPSRARELKLGTGRRK